MRAVDDLYQWNGRGEYRILCTCLGHYLLWNEWRGRQPGFYDRMNYSVFVGWLIHTCSHQIRPNLYPYIYSFFFCEHEMGKGLRVFRNKNMFCEKISMLICEKLKTTENVFARTMFDSTFSIRRIQVELYLDNNNRFSLDLAAV